MSDQIYYQHAGRMPLVKRISYNARMAVYRTFMEELKPTAATTVLDVGVSLDCSSLESNMFEQHYPHRDRITCAGIGDGSEVEKAYPGVKFQRIEPHAPLPFADGQFDMVYSNAVVEHVGSRQEQRKFVTELCRVARSVFVVAPNRLFPVEHHTAIPLIHYLPLPVFRGLLKCTPLRHWGDEDNLNPVVASQVAGFFPAGRTPRIHHVGLGLAFTRSNIVAIA